MKTRIKATLAFSVAIAISPMAHAADIKKDHVLLISIDGMHAVDYENCVNATPTTCPNLAALGKTGINYTRTSTSRPSDSFPGLMALVTGGTPKTVGAFYDVAWDRVLAPPAMDTGNGLVHGNCNAGHNNGTQTEYEEGDEIDQTKLNGGAFLTPSNWYQLIDGGVAALQPLRFVRDPFSTPTACAPVYPWNFIRTNTIYGVIHAAGGFTAWSDKHAVYSAVSGPTGTNTPSNVDDYYSPEVNSNQIPLPGPDGKGIVTAGTNFNCGTIVASGNDWTTDFQAIQCYDQLKVNAVVNWINGKNHLGQSSAPVPSIFGMNFQAVSVGQKLIQGQTNPTAPANCSAAGIICGGYLDAAGTPSAKLESEIVFVDASIGQMVSALKNQGLLDSTTIIITAKHGQSPIDPNRFFPIPGGVLNNGTSPAHLLAGMGLVPAVEIAGPGPTEDDISQLWLFPGNSTLSVTDPAGNVLKSVGALEMNAKTAGIGQIFYGPSLTTMFNAPGVPTQNAPCCALQPGGDPRSPDIIVAPNIGVIYTGSAAKQEEHGGFAFDDTNVMLLVSNPSIQARTITSWVETMQVAPTILQLLDLDPNSLDAVQKEGTTVLPGLFGQNQGNGQGQNQDRQ